MNRNPVLHLPSDPMSIRLGVPQNPFLLAQQTDTTQGTTRSREECDPISLGARPKTVTERDITNHSRRINLNCQP